MPRCAIISCKNASGKVNIRNGGVSYHVFPKNPELKEKWIRSTGRNKWFPTKSSTVCSKHFTDDDFLVTPHKKCIKCSALPHVDVCIVSSFDTSPMKVDNVSGLALKRKQHVGEETITSLKRVRQEDQLFCAINCDRVALNDSPVHFDASPIKVENVSESALKQKQHVVEDTITTLKRVRQEDPLFCAINCDRVALNDSPVHFDISMKVDNVSGSALKRKEHVVEDTVTTTDRVRQEDQLFCAINCDHVALNVSSVHINKIIPSWSNTSTPRKRKLSNIIKNHKQVIMKQRSQLRKLQAQNRRLKRKITKIEDILKDCQKKFLLKNEETSTLKNTDLPNV